MENITIDTSNATESSAKLYCDNARDLFDAANFLARKVIERRNTFPILNYILCEPSETGLKMSGTDLEIMASITVGCRFENMGAFAINALAFADALKKCGNNTVSLEYDAETARIKLSSGRTRLSMQTMPVDDFPVIAEIAKPFKLSLPAEYSDDLALLAPFMSNEEIRYYLKGIAFQSRDIGGRQRIVQVATDGAIMSCFTYPADGIAGAMPDHIVARKTITALLAALKLEKDKPLSWEFSAQGVQNAVSCGNVRIVSKSIDGSYPNALAVMEENAIATDGAPVLIPELIPTIDAGFVTKLEKLAGHALSWELARDDDNGRNMTVISDPARPNWMATAAQGNMPKGYEVRQDRGLDSATRYLMELARSRGLQELTFHHLVRDRDIVKGATFGNSEWTEGYHKTVECWRTLTQKTVYIEPELVWNDGAYSVVMPRERAEIGCDVSIDVDGENYPIATNSAGNIHLSKEAIAKICADDVAPDPLAFETVQVIDGDGARHYVLKDQWEDADVIGFRTFTSEGQRLNAKGKPVSSNIDKSFLRHHLSLVDVTEQAEIATESECDRPAMTEPEPSDIAAPVDAVTENKPNKPEPFTLSGTIRATMPRGGAWDWSTGYQGNEHTPSKAIAHDNRARRLRIVRAYLKMRKERAEMKLELWARDHVLAHCNKVMPKLRDSRRRAVLNAKRHWKMRLVAREQRKTAEQWEAMERTRRQAITLTGRELSSKARRERDIALEQIAKMKSNRADPSNPDKASDLIKLRDERDQARGKLELITAERDRLKASIETSADTLDAMIDRAFRAEAQLRDSRKQVGYRISPPVIAFSQAA